MPSDTIKMKNLAIISSIFLTLLIGSNFAFASNIPYSNLQYTVGENVTGDYQLLDATTDNYNGSLYLDAYYNTEGEGFNYGVSINNDLTHEWVESGAGLYHYIFNFGYNHNPSYEQNGIVPYVQSTSTEVGDYGNLFQVNTFKGKFPFVDEWLGYNEYDSVASAQLDITQLQYYYTPYPSSISKEGFYWFVISRNTSDTPNNYNSRTYNDGYVIPFYTYDTGAYVILGNTELATTTPQTFECNPFTNNIATFFINYDFSLSTCLSGIMSYLFTPSNESISQFTDLKNQIQNKPPFGYFNIIKDNMVNINSSSTEAFSIIIPEFIQDYIFNPFKIALGGLLWFIGLVWLYNRLKHIQL